MNRFIVATAMILTAISGSVSASFYSPSVEEYQTVYQKADAIYRSKKDPAFNAFADMLGAEWLEAHKQQALEKATSHGRNQATADEAWELPYANYWIGCVALQFNPHDFEKYHFETIEQAGNVTAGRGVALARWIDQNKEELKKTKEGTEFLNQLGELASYAAQCETLVRKQPKRAMESMNVQTI